MPWNLTLALFFSSASVNRSGCHFIARLELCVLGKQWAILISFVTYPRKALWMSDCVADVETPNAL